MAISRRRGRRRPQRRRRPQIMRRQGRGGGLYIFVLIVLIVGLGYASHLGVFTYNAGAHEFEQAVVRRIIDGDTIEIYTAGGVTERVRLIGVDAPEMGRQGAEAGAEPGAIEARDFVANLIPVGTQVWLEIQGNDRDRWDRLRRYVWIGPPDIAGDLERQRLDMTVNRLLLSYGHAVVWN